MRLGPLFRLLVVGAVVGPGAPSEAGPDKYGLAFGMRTGYGFPLGTSAQQGNLSDTIKGVVPLWFDAGFRFNPYVYLGAFFQYGFGILPSNASGCNASGTSCSESDVRLGANVHFHFLANSTVDPWVGLGFGYEWLNLTASQAQGSGFGSLRGFEFVNGQLGLDFKILPTLAIGPFFAFAVGQYSTASVGSGAITISGDIQNKGVHEWLIIGVRTQFNVDLN